ncbi:MAG: SGNH/GDSL hydrolase family protein [Candidatus Diapherotrites archaeon]|jgi:lysophospholipase L1-like esterase|uniref:SGNH/GDSL hydrolase family protein n=1 Tax=Candidatus Iainarchaeum sp. TaxID=3101447 RepID=A0A8T5GGR8_9ARCH|nr:SGNH/GDSL hydrolase family protein [Candidatus Diapherotrites archaeon]
MKNILIFGDSITQGYFAVDNFVVRLIVKYLKFTFKHHELVFVQNLGKIGDTSYDLAKRMEENIKLRNHFGKITIIISIGLNDSRVNNKKKSVQVSEKDYLKNLKKIYEIASKYSNKIIFVGLSNVDETKTAPCFWDKQFSYKNKLIIKYDNALKKFAKNNGVPYVETFNKLDTDFLIDGIHPTHKGHKILFDLINKELELSPIPL